jgi:hypothetical protein
MFELVFSPKWFYGYDIVFEIFSIIVTLLVFLYAHKIYKFSKKPEHRYFAIAFLMIAVSFVFKILTNFEIYYSALHDVYIGSIYVGNVILYKTFTLHFIGLFLSRFLMGIAILGIYFVVVYRKRRKSDIIVASYMIAMLVLTSIYACYVFHITMAVLLFFICYGLWGKYKVKRNVYRNMVFYAFMLLFISQIFFSMLSFDTIFYVFGEFVQLIGYLGFLFAYVMIRVKK